MTQARNSLLHCLRYKNSFWALFGGDTKTEWILLNIVKNLQVDVAKKIYNCHKMEQKHYFCLNEHSSLAARWHNLVSQTLSKRRTSSHFNVIPWPQDAPRQHQRNGFIIFDLSAKLVKKWLFPGNNGGAQVMILKFARGRGPLNAAVCHGSHSHPHPPSDGS